MSKPSLSPPYDTLESDIIQTMQAGLKQWRPDLKYPESYSDMQGCVRALLVMFEVKRKPLPELLPSPCPDCGGLGEFRRVENGMLNITTCSNPRCKHGEIHYHY